MNNNYFKAFQIKGLKPHIDGFFSSQMKLAIQEIKNSIEFNKLKDEYLTTTAYSELLSSITEDASDIYANYVQYMIETLYEETEDKTLDQFIASVIDSSYVLQHYTGIGIAKYTISNSFYNSKIGCTLKNYTKKIKKVVDAAIDDRIEEAQVYYAENKLITRPWISGKYWDKVKSILHTIPICSTNEIEQIILSNFDFKAMAQEKDDDSCEACNF